MITYRWWRRVVRTSPVLFRLRLRLRRRPLRSLYPTAGTDLFVTGYPRSANSFTVEWLRRCWPDRRIASHMHTVASLKEARRNRVPTLVLIREPTAAITSALVKRMGSEGPSDSAIDLYVDDYVEYYTYVAEHQTDFLVVGFDTAVRDQATLVNLLDRRFKVQLNANAGSLEDVVAETTAFMQRDGRSPVARPREPERRNFDNPEKRKKKDALIEEVRARRLFARAVELYALLMESISEAWQS